jgi:hypothetical protein
MTERVVKIDPVMDLRLKLRESRFILERVETDDPRFEAQVRNVIKYEGELRKLEGSDKNEQNTKRSSTI